MVRNHVCKQPTLVPIVMWYFCRKDAPIRYIHFCELAFAFDHLCLDFPWNVWFLFARGIFFKTTFKFLLLQTCIIKIIKPVSLKS